MKNIEIVSKVVSREGEAKTSPSKGISSVNLSDYLLKSIWDKAWEIRTDSQGTEYIFGKLPMVTQYGITMYSGDGVDVPSLASGLPFDGRTIWYNPDTNQIEVIGGTGGGSGEGVSNFWDLSGIPSWITISKPKYSYSEIEGTPDLSVFATQNWIINQGYASAEELKKYIPISGYTEVSGEKNFTGGLKVNGSPIYYDTEKKYWKLEGDLLVTGGVTMYGSDSSFTPSTIMDAIAVDGTTISKSGGVLKVIGGTGGGVADSVAWANITGKPTWIGSSKPTYSYSEITGAISTTELQNYLTQNSYLNVTSGDNRYLKLSGGTLTYGLTISAGNLIVSGSDTVTNSLYPTKDNQYTLGNGARYWSNIYTKLINGGTPWTSVNDGSGSGLDADLLDGLDSTDFSRSFVDIGANNYKGNGLGYTYATAGHGGACAGGFISFGDTAMYGCQINGDFRGKSLYFRGIDEGSFTSWKQIAFTDSNVASATKLKKARTIWGNSFDGTGDVYGAISDTYGILPSKDSTYDIGSSSNQYRYVYASWFGAKTGEGLSLGANNSTHLAILSSGNVGIGTDSSKSKLSVHTYTVESISAGYLGTSKTVGFGNMAEGYGTYLWTTGNGNGHIQVGREDGYTNLYHLILQELGGNVGVGESNPTDKLHVAGDIRLKDSSNYGRTIYFGDGEYCYLREASDEQLTIHANQGLIIADKTTINSDLLVSGGNVGIGTTSPTRKLDIVGSMSLTGEYKIGGYDVLRCYNNALEVGRETSFYQSYSTNIWGNDINFYNKEGNRLLAVTNGGNFGFGVATPTSKLHVNGDIATNNYLRVLAWSGYGSGSCNMWYDGNKNQLFVNTGASFSYNCEISGTFTVNGATYLHGDVFVEELNAYDVIPRRTDEYSCGNSSLRWYQVYGNIGDFSGAVNMGSTLNVTGMTTMTNATITGDLRLKDNTNYGRTIYFGDGELCYLEEASDDVLTIYANAGIKLNTSSTSYNVSINTNLLVSGGITMYSQRSLKNIQDERGLSLGELRAIKPIRYTWKDGRDNRIHFGGIADDIQQVLPEVVYKTNDGVLTMDYGNAAFAIASSLIKPVVDHEKRIAMLEEENKQLRQEVERLKSA